MGDEKTNKKFDWFYVKALVVQQKLSMIMFVEYNFHKAKAEFEVTQNMEIPALYGMGRKMILFYFEIMVVFAWNALVFIRPMSGWNTMNIKRMVKRSICFCC